jgi:hypothetical protein
MDQLSNLEKKPEEPTIDMVKFRDEVAEIIIREQLKINIDDLTEEDARIWNKVKNYKPNSLMPGELKAYYQNVENSKNDSRKEFRELVDYKIIPWHFKRG